jgi:hypothetical protein
MRHPSWLELRPRKHHSSNHQRDICDVEETRAHGANADVQEVDDTAVLNAVEQIRCATGNE